MTTPSIPTSRPVPTGTRNGRAGFRAKWLNPGLGKRRHNLGQAPTISINDKDDEVVDEDAAGETDPEAQAEDEEAAEDEPAQTAAQEPPKERKIQILDLESDNPLISFRDHIFTCQWAKNIGTELLFTKHDSQAKLPTLRKLPNDVDLLGACCARIVSKTATLVKTHKEETRDPLAQEADGPLVESVSAAASDDRRQQARFLEQLMKIKKRKSEPDEVTVIAYKRLRRSQWIDMLNRKRNEERAELRQRLKTAEGSDYRDIEKRLQQLDEEEKNMPDVKEARAEEGEDGEWGPTKRPGKTNRRPGRKKTILGSEMRDVAGDGVAHGLSLRTGERVEPVRRRPRGSWKRYNIDGTLAEQKVPGGKEIWKGWHENMQNGEGDAPDDAEEEDDDDAAADGQDEDGDEQMTDARHRESSFMGYETELPDRQSSIIGPEFYEDMDQSMHRASSALEYDHSMPHAQSYPGSRMFTREGSAVSTHSLPFGFSGTGLEGAAPLQPNPALGIGFRDDAQSSRPGSSSGIGFRIEETHEQLQSGVSAPGDVPTVVAEAEHPAPPPGGWLGLLEDDDIQLPEH